MLEKPVTRTEMIQSLGLAKYVLELEADGLTVVPPDVHKVSSERFDEMTTWLLHQAEIRVGCPFTLEHGPQEELHFPPDEFGPGKPGGPRDQFLIQQLALEARVFRDLAVNSVAVALMRYMIGAAETRFSSHNAFLKWTGETGYGPNLGMHTDQSNAPLPWGRMALTANTNWLLTDYTPDAGPLAYVPGSHRYQSRPVLPEAVERAVPVVAPRGSLVVFHGATWHGAFPRRLSGMRLMVSNYYRHSFVLPQDDLKNGFPRDLVEDCDDPSTFKILAGFDDQFPYTHRAGPSPKLARTLERRVSR